MSGVVGRGVFREWKWYNMSPINMSNKRLLLGRKNAKMRYSAAYHTGAEHRDNI
jgi:hypothetical protein